LAAGFSRKPSEALHASGLTELSLALTVNALLCCATSGFQSAPARIYYAGVAVLNGLIIISEIGDYVVSL
jgi:hypothetical protein